MQELKSRFSVVDGRNQTLQKELEGLRGKMSLAPGTELAMPHDGFQMSSGRQVLPWCYLGDNDSWQGLMDGCIVVREKQLKGCVLTRSAGGHTPNMR
eukprot:2083980-Amphidinium_carterae.1